MPTDRRKHHKVVSLGLERIVTELLAAGKTYDEIEEHLRGMGKEIGASSIRRYNNDIQRKLVKLRQTNEAASAICDMMKENGSGDVDSKMSDMLVGLLQHTLIEKLGDDELSTKDIVGLALAGARVVGSKTSLEKLKDTEKTRSRKAWEKVMAESKTLLEQSGLWAQVEAVLVTGMNEALE
ncbi:DUF3486 family protein [Candidatus Sumerlaeota bacterium]|nr:DUF3486 family protein [Candidatus Sumerlaeota bacterium]